MNDKMLVDLAFAAMDKAYAPYSAYKVGAALLTVNGKVYTGCNIENASYGVTNCAERTAFYKAVSEGDLNFAKIAIVGGKDGNVTDICVPCGICRQVIAEFCEPDFEILCASGRGSFERYTLKELLPMSFSVCNITE